MNSLEHVPEALAELADMTVTIDTVSRERFRLHHPGHDPETDRISSVLTLTGKGEMERAENVCYGQWAHNPDHPNPFAELAGTTAKVGVLQKQISAMTTRQIFPGFPGELPEKHRAASYTLFVKGAAEAGIVALALAQNGKSMADLLGITPRPPRFVISQRIDGSTGPVDARLRQCKEATLKLDVQEEWGPEVVKDLARYGILRARQTRKKVEQSQVVETVDWKGFYRGTEVDMPTRMDLYELVAQYLRGIIHEDPDLNKPDVAEFVQSMKLITALDAPIDGLDAIINKTYLTEKTKQTNPWLAQEYQPDFVNIKPARVGGIKPALELAKGCQDLGIEAYMGASYELDVGRPFIEGFAVLINPDAPNDVAPIVFHEEHPSGLVMPRSNRLIGTLSPTGLEWHGDPGNIANPELIYRI